MSEQKSGKPCCLPAPPGGGRKTPSATVFAVAVTLEIKATNLESQLHCMEEERPPGPDSGQERSWVWERGRGRRRGRQSRTDQRQSWPLAAVRAEGGAPALGLSVPTAKGGAKGPTLLGPRGLWRCDAAGVGAEGPRRWLPVPATLAQACPPAGRALEPSALTLLGALARGQRNGLRIRRHPRGQRAEGCGGMRREQAGGLPGSP